MRNQVRILDIYLVTLFIRMINLKLYKYPKKKDGKLFHMYQFYDTRFSMNPIKSH